MRGSFLCLIILFANFQLIGQTQSKKPKSKFEETFLSTLDQYKNTALSPDKPTFTAYADRPFGLAETNFFRFEKSPCYDKLGFRPHKMGTRGYEQQVKEYKQCEKEYRIGLVLKTLIILIVGIGVFFLTKKLKGKLAIKVPRYSKCHYCQERIKKGAVICKHCKSNLT